MIILFLCYLIKISYLKHISIEGLNFIKKHEGLRLNSYEDIGSLETIGYGTTSNDHKITGIKISNKLKITKEIASLWIEKSMKYKYERMVNHYDKIYNFNQNQFDALISFVYNLGEHNLNELTKNGKRTIEQISNKIPLYNKFFNKTSNKIEISPVLFKRRNEEKEMFDKIPDKSGKKYKLDNIHAFRTDLGSILSYITNDKLQTIKDGETTEYENMNIIYYDLNNNEYRTKCRFTTLNDIYSISCINTVSIQYTGNIYIKLQSTKILLNGDEIEAFDSKNFNEQSLKYYNYKIIDDFTKLKITHFSERINSFFDKYYIINSYRKYFTFTFRIASQIREKDFPENFQLKIYSHPLYVDVEEIVLKCYRNILSIFEEEFDYEYIINCYGDSNQSIYERRNSAYYLNFKSYMEALTEDNKFSAYRPIIMYNRTISVNGLDPFSVIKIQKYKKDYHIMDISKTLYNLSNYHFEFNGIYIKKTPNNILSKNYFDYGIYFITNYNEKLNTVCLIVKENNNEITLKCKIAINKLSNDFKELKEGIYNSYIFIAQLDNDYLLNKDNKTEILEKFTIDINGTVVLSRIDDYTTKDDLEKGDPKKLIVEDFEKSQEPTYNSKDNKDEPYINYDSFNLKITLYKFILLLIFNCCLLI